MVKPVLICRSCGAHCRIRHPHPFVLQTVFVIVLLLLGVGGPVAYRAFLFPHFILGWLVVFALSILLAIGLGIVEHRTTRYELFNEP